VDALTCVQVKYFDRVVYFSGHEQAMACEIHGKMIEVARKTGQGGLVQELERCIPLRGDVHRGQHE
jgi:hypothetical protein